MLELKKLWTFNANDVVEMLAFSDDGYLGVASWNHCAYVLDQKGKIVDKHCGDYAILGISSCCGKFGFVNCEGCVYIYDTKSRTWKEMETDPYHGRIVTILKDGFLAGCCRLAYFDFQGNKKWDVPIEYIRNRPVVHKEYVYVPRYECCDNGVNALTILKLSDGSEVRTIRFNEYIRNIQVCGNYLAVGTSHHVYFYDIDDPANPRLLWSFDEIATNCDTKDCYGAWDIAFSPDCKYLASIDYNYNKVHIFVVQSEKRIFEKRFRDSIRSIAWWEDRIAIGSDNGIVYVYKVVNPLIMGLSNIIKSVPTRNTLPSNSKNNIQLVFD